MPDAAAATPAVAPSTPGIVAAPQPAAPSDDAWISPASLAQPKDDAWIAPTLSGDNLAGSVVGGDLGQGIPQPPETSVIGTATRGIERAIIPTATGAVGAGMGGEIGAGIGALGGPLAPVTIPIGAVTGSLIGAFAGAMAGGAGQQAAIDALPKAAQDFLGQSKEQQQADIAAHPVIAELAVLAPSFAVLGPGTIAKELPKTAGVFERLLANPVTARIASASLFGAQTAAQEKLEGQPLDPMAIGLSAGAGAFMTKPTALGKQLIGAGALSVKAAADFLRPTTPEAVAAPIIGADNIDDAIAAAKTVADKPIDLAAAGAEATQQAAPAPAEGLDAFGGLNPGTIERAADGTYSFRSTDPSGQETVTPMRPAAETAQGQLALSPTVIDAQRDHYAKLGVDVVYFKDDPAIPFDGAVDPAHPNTIFLSDNPTRNAAQIGAHEVTHILESTTLPDGSNLGDLLHQQVMAGITNEGLDFANRVFGPTAPERAAFPTGPEGDSAHADAVVNHLVRELGADIGGEAPKFADFSGRVVDAVQQRYGEQTAKTVLQKLIDGLRAAMDTLRGFFGGGKDATTVSQNFVTNLSEIHDTLAQMYAAKFGSAIEKEQAAVQAMMGRAQPAENVSRGTEQAQTARLAPLPAPEAPEAPQTAPAATAAAPKAPLPQAPESAAERVAAPSELESLDPAKIKVDAARFQFKAGGDQAGVTERLQGVTQFDPRLAGTALVFRDGAGQDFIVDGHQRLALANRLTQEGQLGIRINAFVLNSADGITAADARAIAAAKNIAEGTGTAIDAAKIMREAAIKSVKLPELPPRSALVRDGKALAKLSPDAFGMAVNEVVPHQQAAVVGRLVADGPDQVEAMRLLAEAKPENAHQAEMIVRDMMATGTERATTTGSLFGPETTSSSVVLERAKIADEARRLLTRDKAVFRTLVAEAQRIESHGKNALDAAANQERQSTDEQAAQHLTTLATRKGPVSDALTGIARRFKAGELSRRAAATEFLDAVRGAVEGGGNTRPDVGGPVAGPARAVEDRTLLSPKTERNEPVLSAEYQAALRDHTIAADDYRQALSDYRTRRIGDAEFLAAKAKYNEATAAFDAAYAKEQAKEPPLLNAPEASAAEMSARQRQTEREEAELRMRGRQGATAAQEGSGDLPLFGGERQATLFSPKREASIDDIHRAAEDRGIPWNDDAAFMAMTKKLTGKERLDDLSAAERGKVYNHIAEQSPPRDLIIQHNVTAANLMHSDRMGGIAAPSLAITRARDSSTNFGEITLIGPKEMADPKGYAGTKVYGADIYSPRYPTVDYKVDAPSLKRLNAILAPYRETGEREIYGAEINRPDDLHGNKAFDKYAKEKFSEHNADGNPNGYVDYRAAGHALLQEAGAPERIFRGFTNMGNKSYKPHTLDNVVSILKKDLRAGEGFNYGVGSLRSKVTPQFRSIEQIRKNADRLVSKEDFDKIKKDVDEEFWGIAEQIRPYSNRGKEFGFGDTVINAMMEAPKIGLRRALDEYGIKDVPDHTLKAAAEFLDKLRDFPTEYFEAKILRGVGLSEFRIAVIPDNTVPKVRELLAKRGVQAVEYKAGDPADRKLAVMKASGAMYDSVRFSPKVSAATRERLGPAFASMFARAGESGLVPAIDREPANVNTADRRIAGTVRPIEGTGEEKQRAVSPLQTYHVGEEAPQIAAAAKLLADDPERAIAVAMRQKQPPPGVHPEYVFMAVEAKATRDGDTALIAQLSNSRIAEEATAMGQRIGAYKNRDPLSAVAKIDEVQKARLEAVKANVGDVGRAQQAEAQNIKRAVKTAVATRARPSWNDFIASIVCPS